MTVLNGRDRAVDLLEDEDLELRRLFTRLHATRGGSVVERPSMTIWSRSPFATCRRGRRP
jgi:hypothetical protein